jgi:hypothetical protein
METAEFANVDGLMAFILAKIASTINDVPSFLKPLSNTENTTCVASTSLFEAQRKRLDITLTATVIFFEVRVRVEEESLASNTHPSTILSHKIN